MPPSNLSVPDNLVLTSNAIELLALKGTSTPAIAAVYAPSTAPVDGDLANNTIVPSIDETNDALDVRVKYSDGTLQTGIVPFVRSTLTVAASGADFTTIQAAWDYLKGRYLSSLVTIDVAAGTYNETVRLGDQPYAGLIKIQGDTRTAAGSHVATTGNITKSGSNCTITLVSAPPSDFTSSDFVVIGGAATPANVGRFLIVSIDTVNKTVTYTNASGVAEAVRSHTQVIFCPNRIIDFTSSGNLAFDAVRGGGTTVTGFTLLSTTTVTFVMGIRVQSATLSVSHCTAFGLHDGGFAAIRGGVLATDVNCAAIKVTTGFQATETGAVICDGTYSADSATGYAQVLGGGYVRANSAVATNCAIGFLTQAGGTISATSATASHNTDSGFKAQENSAIYANGATARNNATGYAATLFGMITATSTSANNSGNGTNYNPPTSGTEGNSSGLIFWT